MKLRVIAGVGVVAFAVGIGVGALAESRAYEGDTVETHVVVIDQATRFNVSDAAFDDEFITVPGMNLTFDVAAVATWAGDFNALGSVELRDAVDCDTAPPIGQRIGIAARYRGPSGDLSTFPGVLVEAGTYTVAGRFAGIGSGLGAYNCDTLSFSVDPVGVRSKGAMAIVVFPAAQT